jgi:uncharacterized protein YutE (UPF0331/DUF86 family)
MVYDRGIIEKRLKELDQILQEMGKYRALSPDAYKADLSKRWIIERGLIAAASMIFDIADHILTGQFGYYGESYEGSLESLCEKKVIPQVLHDQMKGLGGFRNILIHSYIEIDPQEVFENFQKALNVFPRFAQEIITWMDSRV